MVQKHLFLAHSKLLKLLTIAQNLLSGYWYAVLG